MSAKETAILVRLTNQEKDLLQRKARDSGMNVSEYIRKSLIHSGNCEIRVVDISPLNEVLYELMKQGGNLNQFMKFLNTYGVSVFDSNRAEQVMTEQESVLVHVMDALAALRKTAEQNNVHLKNGKQPRALPWVEDEGGG